MPSNYELVLEVNYPGYRFPFAVFFGLVGFVVH